MAGAKKTRRGAAKGAARPRKPPAAAAKSVPVENALPGTILHLGDGRRLGFGERATVRPAIAALLTAQGQARVTSR
jgi:hypothetical protein